MPSKSISESIFESISESIYGSISESMSESISESISESGISEFVFKSNPCPYPSPHPSLRCARVCRCGQPAALLAEPVVPQRQRPQPRQTARLQPLRQRPHPCPRMPARVTAATAAATPRVRGRTALRAACWRYGTREAIETQLATRVRGRMALRAARPRHRRSDRRQSGAHCNAVVAGLTATAAATGREEKLHPHKT